MAAVLAPSILSADFARLGADVKETEAGGAALIHVDVMDGHFVPNITIGSGVTKALRKVTDLPLDCHLMISEPDRHVDDFIAAGADMISVHVEAATHLHRTVHRIRDGGVKAGVVLNPSTPLSALDEILGDVDFVLLMSVNPGFGGQKLIPSVLQKARALRQRLDLEAPDVRLEIDGGVTVDNVTEVAACGIDMIVTGSAVFGSGDIRGTTERMVRQLAELAERERTC
ncbi:MAG: ribulose-phosphate 3-epimerase [Acidobacteria bacterium]|nr:ribulose-phosphate 3-epimerase [Acidobacteriota bacterium]NIM63360.1 ribulose-phosphate 3-epimerase [Acidobacteriota bacterium]NIO60069.1 ribulose-phosphate 3-epimerase [Acidobacteriota bacterium]NIQ31477.1 ribulose-phosphate 3-epimerase [Acidobacteriota bacterium]NIQ86252.1 ribulose-phosphate 3-epimerase [Acidobacteriota bacterium]